jgi:hypothetical protein
METETIEDTDEDYIYQDTAEDLANYIREELKDVACMWCSARPEFDWPDEGRLLIVECSSPECTSLCVNLR